MSEQMGKNEQVVVERQRGMSVRKAFVFVREHAGRISSMRFNAFLRQLDESNLPQRATILRDQQGRIKEIGFPAIQWMIERLQNERPIVPDGWLSLKAMCHRLGCGYKLMLEIVSDILPTEDEANTYKDPVTGVVGLYYCPDFFLKCEQALPFYRERQRQIRQEVAQRVNRERKQGEQEEKKEDDHIPRMLDMAATIVFLRAHRLGFVPSQFSSLIRSLEQSNDPARVGIIRDPEVGTIKEIHRDALQWLLHAPGVSIDNTNDPTPLSEGEKRRTEGKKRRMQEEEIWKKKSLGYQHRLRLVLLDRRIDFSLRDEARFPIKEFLKEEADARNPRAIVRAADLLLEKTGYQH